MIGRTNARGTTIPVVINFTIGSTTYNCENGMTWTDWCASSYCPTSANAFISNNTVWYFGSNTIDNVTPNDVIISGANYTYTYYSSGSID